MDIIIEVLKLSHENRASRIAVTAAISFLFMITCIHGCLAGNAYGAPTRTNHPPNAVITSPEDGGTYPDNNPIRFDATDSNDPDGDELSFTWTLMMFPPQPGPGMFPTIKYVAAFSQSLDVGSWMVSLDVNDSAASDSLMIMISVIKNNAPTSVIASPGDGEVYTTDDDIPFDSAGSQDPDGHSLTFHWESSHEGNLTELASFSTPLSEGSHTIKLVVKDIYDSESVSEIDITVRIPNYLPNIFITAPDSSNPRVTDEFEIRWTASDANVNDMIQIDLFYNEMKDTGTKQVIAQGLPNVGSYVWDVSDITIGDYYVYGVVTDEEGATGSSWGTGYVRVHRNHPPSTVTGFELEDPHELTPALVWEDCTDPNDDAVSYLITIGTSPGGNEIADSTPRNDNRYRVSKTLEFNRTYHVIIMTVDSWGMRSEGYEGTFELDNLAPSPPEMILEPAQATSTSPIRCTLIAPSVDPDGDDITYTYRWLSRSPGGFFEEAGDIDGNEVSAGRLEAGDEWRCEVTATDGHALSETAISTTIIRNIRPVAVISSPTALDGIYTSLSRKVELSAEGSYDDDGDELEYTWSLEQGGVLGDRETITVQLASDINKITLTVSDGTDSGFAMITIVVTPADIVVEDLIVNPAKPQIGKKVLIYGEARNLGGDQEDVVVEFLVDGVVRGKNAIGLFPHSAAMETKRFQWVPQSSGSHIISVRVGGFTLEKAVRVEVASDTVGDDDETSGPPGSKEGGDSEFLSLIVEKTWLLLAMIGLLSIIAIFGILIIRENRRKERRRKERDESEREEKLMAAEAARRSDGFNKGFNQYPSGRGLAGLFPPMPMFDNRIFDNTRLLPAPSVHPSSVIDIAAGSQMPPQQFPRGPPVGPVGVGIIAPATGYDTASSFPDSPVIPVFPGAGTGADRVGRPAEKEIVMVECYNCGGDISTTSAERPLIVVCPHCGTEGELN